MKILMKKKLEKLKILMKKYIRSENLSKLMNQELNLIKKLEGRDEGTYDYEIDKTKDKIIDLIMNCQGVPIDKKNKKRLL